MNLNFFSNQTMNWFRRSSRSPSVRQSSKVNSPNSDDQKAALVEAFRSHWTQANEIIVQQQQQLDEPTQEQITTVFRHLDQMILLLITEVNSQTDLTIGPILDCVFTENILQHVLVWTFACTGENADLCRRSMLRLYESLLNQSQFCLLVHKPILSPMLTLLEECSRVSPQQSDVEQLFVLLLNQICVKITEKENSPLLEFFFNPSTDEGPPKFLVFTFLIPYLYNEGNVGQLARDALLLLLSVSANVESVGRFIAEYSNFCPVLATGLSALFSALPRRLASRVDDWHRITDDDIDSIVEIRSFYNALEFCNAVVQVGHNLVSDRLLDFIYNGFLVSVMGAALHENSLEELVAATAYLELFFRTATEAPLLRILLKFILTEQYDGAVLLDTLITRISSNSRLCIVSLALFEMLLNLNCEDLMFELVLKYLIPCTHIMVSQANNLSDVDYYGKSAQRFLSLIPGCCLISQNGDISSASSACSLNGQENMASSDRQNIRQGTSASDKSSTTSISTSNGSVVYEVEPDVTMKPREVTYLEYLHDAHYAISECATACSCWRFPYDGKTPDPTLFREESSFSRSHSSNANEDQIASENESTIGESPRDESSQESIESSSGDKKNESLEKPSESAIQPGSTNQQQPTVISAFKRGGSFRKSKTNRYYNARTAVQNVGGGIAPVPELDLALGGEEEGFDEEEEDVELDNFQSSDENRKPHLNRKESQDSSSGSTPRHQTKNDVMSASMPVDYFKLAFDDESLYGGVSDSQEESDIGGFGNQYVLRGWNQIQDMQTFLEVLHRVRPSRTASQQTLQELVGYIDGVHDVVQRSSSLDGDNTHTNETMASSKDSGVDVGDNEVGNKEENQTLVIHIPLKSSFTSPNIGPFFSVLLHKLDNMLQNSLFMNLHLTGVLTRLACYPQVLTTSFLLNYSLVFQPAVRSLHQVLTSLRHKVDSYACTIENFDKLLVRGRIFLLQRERRHEFDQRRRQSRGNFPVSFITFNNKSGDHQSEFPELIDRKNHSRTRQKKTEGRLRNFKNLLQSQLSVGSSRDESSGHPNGRAGSLDTAGHRGYQHFLKSQDLTLESMKTKNVIYSAIVLEEFLKELAAISQEHAVRRLDPVQHNQQNQVQPSIPSVSLSSNQVRLGMNTSAI